MFAVQLLDYLPLFFTCLGFCLFGAVVQLGNGEAGDDDEAGTPRRRKSRPSDERGLPDKKTLQDMACAYLELQCRHWPELVKSGVLLKPMKTEVDRLVKEFEDRFLERTPVKPIEVAGTARWDSIAAAYVRFSCDKSNPRSLVQQLKLILDKAATNRHFIPWQLVFADAGVSATISDRVDYQHLNQAMELNGSHVGAAYIDEVGRASRDMVEALRLGVAIVDQGKHLIGVSDGFDSRIPMWKMNLTFCGMMQEAFIDQLRAKVDRGMRDADERGTNLRPPAIGYKLIPAVDDDGKPMLGRDGEHLKKMTIDETTAPTIQEVFDLYANKRWSLNRIGRLLNDRKFGQQQWDSSRVRQILTRYKYVGINVESMTRVKRVSDASGRSKKTIVKRPRKEWRAKRVRHLQIVPWSLWKVVQGRLAESTEIYSKTGEQRASRTSFNRTVLVRPICGCCKQEMALGSAGDYPTFTCLNGREGKKDCTYRGYKTCRHIEDAVLGHVLKGVLNDERIGDLVDRANAFLKSEAAKPRVDTRAWKAEIKQITAKRDRLAAVLDNSGEEGLDVIVAKLRKHKQRIDELRELVREAESHKVSAKPIEAKDVLAMLPQAREILGGEVAQAAELLYELTGPVVIHLKDVPGSKRPAWTAVFSVNLVPVFAKLARNSGSPTASAWEYLSTHGWKNDEPAIVSLEKPKKYEVLAPDVLRLHQKGLSVSAIGAALGVFWQDAQHALQFALTGKRPEWKPKKSRNKGPHRKKENADHGCVRAIKGDVARLREEMKFSWKRIQQWLANERPEPIKVAINTIVRAYDESHKDECRKSSETGEPIYRGPYSHIGVKKEQAIRELAAAGLTNKAIAAQVGVSVNTVVRFLRTQQGK